MGAYKTARKTRTEKPQENRVVRSVYIQEN